MDLLYIIIHCHKWNCTSIKVVPASGSAMKTNFTIEASGFQDTDLPLTYNFGYRDEASDQVTWLGRVTDGAPVVETFLPASQSGIVGVVEVCDSYQACTTTETPETISVTLQKFTDQDIS